MTVDDDAAGKGMVNGVSGLTVFIVAGEASGDNLGGRLMTALTRETAGAVRFVGIGGEAMMAQGLESLFPMEELSLMGLMEIVPHIPRLRRRIREAAEAVESIRPDVIVTIDSPGFCKRMIDRLPSWDIPRVHYVAPTVWAWRPKRVHAFKARFDRLLTLLPFEPPYFEAVGLKADFVGHPVLESGAGAGDGPAFRKRHGIDADRAVFCLLPGSRRGEIDRLLSILAETATQIAARVLGAAFVIPSVAAMQGRIQDAIQQWPESVRPTVVGTSEKYDAMAASNVAIAASGTVALELAQARLPAVIGYRVNGITYKLVRAISDIPYVHLLNILAQRFIVPELLQGDCTPEKLSTVAVDLLGEAGDRQIEELIPYLNELRPSGGFPSEAAARAILEEVANHKEA